VRPTGRASVSPYSPRAHAVCDRCGFRFNHDRLGWQYQWQGPRLQNIRLLVCPNGCLDKPQEQLRTIVLPPDPIPISNARPEDYINADNPMSGIGVSANFMSDFQQYGTPFGNLTGGAGIVSVFDGNKNKPSQFCALNTISNSSYSNYVGMNWQGNVANLNMPSSMLPPVVTHSLQSFTAYAPNDRGFLGSATTDYVVQAGAAEPMPFGGWTTISSGTTTGLPGESITADCVGGAYQFHRIAFLGDQLNYISVAQVEFNVAQVESLSEAS
jgi:hypothetical protein